MYIHAVPNASVGPVPAEERLTGCDRIPDSPAMAGVPIFRTGMITESAATQKRGRGGHFLL